MLQKKHEISIRLDPAHQVYDTDWNGRIIEDSDKVFGRMNCAIEVDSERRVVFGIRSSLPRVRIKDNEENEIEKRLSFLTREIIAAYLAKCIKIDIFNIHIIALENYLGKHLTKTPEDISDCFSQFTCEIGNEAFEKLKKHFGNST